MLSDIEHFALPKCVIYKIWLSIVDNQSVPGGSLLANIGVNCICSRENNIELSEKL